MSADDLAGYVQCHFFAGIGVWPYALRQAGWPDERPVWSGSCPCQPGSEAGLQLGFDDPRHLWPEWLRLIKSALRTKGVVRPRQIFGEQVAAWGQWIDLVSTDLEALAFAFTAVDLPAAGFEQGAHERQRFYWVADSDNAEWWADRAPRNLGDGPTPGRVKGYGEFGGGGEIDRLAIAEHGGCEGGWTYRRRSGPALSSSPTDWLFCRDSAWRPVEPGSSPLVASAPARMASLRGYGNALDAATAKAFVAAYLAECP